MNPTDSDDSERPESPGPVGQGSEPSNTEAPLEEPSSGENRCPECEGAGLVNGSDCPECGGTGWVNEPIGGG